MVENEKKMMIEFEQNGKVHVQRINALENEVKRLRNKEKQIKEQ